MSKWPLKKLGDHIIESKKQYGSEKLNGIQVLSVTNDQGFINSEKRTSENVSNYKIVKDKYFAYNPYRINVGSLAYAGSEYIGIVSPAYVVFYCASDLDPEYLWKYLKSDVGLFHIRQGGKGSVRSSLSFERLQEIEIPLPPLPEQKRIVKKIKEIEEKSKKLKKQDQISFNGANSVIDSYVEKLILANAKWKRFPLKQKAKINPSKAEINDFDSKKEVSFLPMPAVDDKTGTIKAPLIKKYSEVKSGYTYFRDGDVIFAKITPCMENGKSAICANLVNGVGFGSTEFHVIRPNTKEILPEWIHLVIRSKKFREEAEKNMPGTAGQKRVPKEFLEDYLFPVPEIMEQKKIIEHAEKLIKKQELLKFEINKRGNLVSALMPSLLAKAFNGEL